jgi:hypothetical protein
MDLLAPEAEPLPPRDAHADRVLYGLSAPLRALRRLAFDPELRKEAIYPAFLLALVCAGVAILTTFPGLGTFRRFYQVFVFLAPLPSVFLAGHYARFAKLVHERAGRGPCEPLYEPIGIAIWRAISQLLLIAIALTPLTLLLHLVPFVGTPIVKAIAGVWALHWILVNAFESARVLEPGQTFDDVEALADHEPPPWFVRGLRAAGDRIPALGGFLRAFAGFCDRLAKPWREEMHLAEQHPALTVGFAITTAFLLCTPVLNLFFRPVVLIAAADVRARLDGDPPA